MYTKGTHSFTALAPLAIKMWIGREFVCFKLDVDYSKHINTFVSITIPSCFFAELCVQLEKILSRAGKLEYEMVANY